MILDLRELKKTGKTEESFFFEYIPNKQLSSVPETEILSPIKIDGDIYLTGEHSAEVEGEIFFTLKGSCTRCLESAEREYVIPFCEACGEEDGYPVSCDKIDLGKIVDDAIIMNMPVKFLCKDDCKGICPDCGVNLNDAACKCEK